MPLKIKFTKPMFFSALGGCGCGAVGRPSVRLPGASR